MDVSPDQIATGLNELANHPGDWPPNAVKFRQLCLGEFLDADGNDIGWQHKKAAYIAFNDERHPDYRRSQKRLEDGTEKERKRELGNSELSKIKNLF